MKKLLALSFLAFLLAFLVIVFQPATAYANHSWGHYHWARSSNPFIVRLGDNVSPQWDQYLLRAAYNWNLSSVLEVPIVPGSTSPLRCRATTAQVQVCNASYGNTGWLGLAQIWADGDHITQATVKLNDTFFNTPRYNTSAWKNLVMCQEIGHTFGLDHQDENFTNPPLGTCMDYTNDPTPNQTPNAHDYSQLLYIYSHFETGIASEAHAHDATPTESSDLNNPSEWGRPINEQHHYASSSNHIAEYERDYGAGKKMHTVVIWAQK